MDFTNQRGALLLDLGASTKRFRRRMAAVCLAAGAVNFTLSRSASAQIDNWTAGSGNWNTPGNWNNGVPATNTETVNIIDADAVKRTIHYNYNGPAVTLGSLTINNTGASGTNALSMTTAGLFLTASNEYVGGAVGGLVAGVGTLTQSSGTNTTVSGNLDIGENAGANGVYSLSGDGTVAVGGFEDVGYSGAGVFNQSGGMHTITSDLRIAYNAGSTGTFVLSGDGTLAVSGNELMGWHGTGNFNQSAGTNTVGGYLQLATNVGATGTFTLSGDGSLAVANDVLLGTAGTGNFNQSGGTFTDSYNLVIGGNLGSTGTFALSGDGTLSVGSNEGLGGGGGLGIFNQSGGFHSIGNMLYLGGFGGTGTFILSGDGTLSTGGNEVVGTNGGIGNFNQSGGLNKVGASLNLGSDVGSTGTFILSSTGSVSVGNSEFVGNSGTGLFNQSGGVNSISGAGNTLFLGGSLSGSGGTGTYLLSGTGLLKVSGGASEFVGYQGAGIFNQAGGTNTLGGTGILTVGETSGSSGSYWLSGNGILFVGANEIVGDFAPGIFNQSGGMNTVGTTLNVGVNAAGTYLLSGTGTLFTRIEDIGGVGGAGTFNQSGGSNGASHITIDYNSVYLLSGTGVSVPQINEFIGIVSTGAYNQSGGTNLIPGGSFLYLGYQSGGTGTYALSGTGTLSAGSEYIGYNGVGNFNQSGGSNTSTGVAGIVVGFDSLNHSTSSYVLSAGSVSSQIETIGFDTAGIFNQSGGMNKVAPIGQNSTELDIAAAVGSIGVYNLTGGTLQASSVYVGGAGPAFVANGAAGGSGTLTVMNTGSLSVTGTLKVWNPGRVNLDMPKTNVGTLTLVGKGTVNLNGGLNINYGSPANDPVATIVSYLKNGYNNGAWNGTSGIVSTSITGGSPALSIGYVDSKTDSNTQAGPNQIVVKYTLLGDANLDGLVNFNDLVAVVQNFNAGGTDWAHGNFGYGISTNFNDLVAVVQNFNKILPPPSGSSVSDGGTTFAVAPTAVRLPEPAAMGSLAGLAAFRILARRRRKHAS